MNVGEAVELCICRLRLLDITMLKKNLRLIAPWKLGRNDLDSSVICAGTIQQFRVESPLFSPWSRKKRVEGAHLTRQSADFGEMRSGVVPPFASVAALTLERVQNPRPTKTVSLGFRVLPTPSRTIRDFQRVPFRNRGMGGGRSPVPALSQTGINVCSFAATPDPLASDSPATARSRSVLSSLGELKLFDVQVRLPRIEPGCR